MNGLTSLLERSSPEFTGRLRTIRYKHALRRLAEKITTPHGLSIQGGPFRGMTYLRQLLTPDGLLRHAVVPKLLGCYEEELHATLTRVCERQYERVINVGCAEGYYAIGLARRMPDVRVYAFDIDAGARALCAEMARANAVADRVVVGGECTTEDLQALTSGRSLVVCDCEGCELALLRPDLVRGLTTCDIIVELHDCVDPSISPTILARFAGTHYVTSLSPGERDPGGYPALKGLRRSEQRLAVSEFRWGPLQWAFFSSK